MPEKFSLKDALFNRAKVQKLADEIHRVYSDFNKAKFTESVLEEFPRLELKARIAWIAECIRRNLPKEYAEALRIILEALPPPNDPSLSDDDFGDFIYAPYAEYVAKNAWHAEHLQLSLKALYEITQRFSVENAIRSFLNAFPRETMEALLSWTKDPHYHVRRLCSEGTRPKLPWAKKITIPIEQPIQLLDELFFDEKRFVTRSVANHMNDLSKIDPDLTLSTLLRWKKSGKQRPDEMDYLIRHALRTLVKQGHPKALELLGFRHEAALIFSNLSVPEQSFMNENLEFSFEIKAEEDSKILIDYVLYFQNKAGQLKGKKVFKLTKFELKKGASQSVSKRHLLRQKMTTRTLYPGLHRIEIQVNGRTYGAKHFMLIERGD